MLLVLINGIRNGYIETLWAQEIPPKKPMKFTRFIVYLLLKVISKQKNKCKFKFHLNKCKFHKLFKCNLCAQNASLSPFLMLSSTNNETKSYLL